MTASSLPLARSIQPTSAAEVADEIRVASAARQPVYPLGGGTSLDYGLPVTEPGLGLSLAGMSKIVDYPARDMTVTIEAGVKLAALATELAKEGQQLPFDVPQASQATLGGIVATNFNGPRRYHYGAIRDYVIGIEAVDGTGRIFHGGGRVVKNVAGYDFCKLLTGSLGTLGVITQLTFKLRPLPETSALFVARLPDGVEAREKILARMSTSATYPVAIEVLAGKTWNSCGLETDSLAVLLEGTADEVAWMTSQLQRELTEVKCSDIRPAPDNLWPTLVEFPADDSAAVVLQAHVVPSGVVPFIARVQQLAPDAALLAHAGQGSIFLKFASPPSQGFSRLIVNDLQPLAAAHHGKLVVLSHRGSLEPTPQLCWAGSPAAFEVMQSVKRQFDPQHLLNRGRFVFGK